MLILAVAFLFVALGHPEMSFPWGNGITYTLYAIYALIMVVLFIAPFKKSNGTRSAEDCLCVK